MEWIAQAAQIACLLEVSAPKPGNINRLHDFTNTRFEDFLLSAAAIGPAMARSGRAGVGRTIYRAVYATQRLVHTNTNLGIVLLLAPLAKARHSIPGERVSRAVEASRLRESLAKILAGLTVADAQLAYAAIRLASPGGMGKTPQADISAKPAVTLYQAMALAQDWDAVAREYVTDFAITFEIGYPGLRDAWLNCSNISQAIVQAYLTILAQTPDTLIARKRGTEMADQVSEWARDVLARGGVLTISGRAGLAELERTLSDEGHTLNPGTTADLTTASLFLFLISGGFDHL